MNRKKIIVGNWKMFKTLAEAEKDYISFVELTKDIQQKIDLGFAVPSIGLANLSTKRKDGVSIYAQNVHFEKEGAFTGEISTHMLKDIHVEGSVIGHSERRQYFGETNQSAGKRMSALLRQNMECIFCIGETLKEREAGQVEKIIYTQISEAFTSADNLTEAEIIGSNPNRPLLSIAYEPVWAIGTGKAATPTEAEAAHTYLRQVLIEVLGQSIASKIRLLYGGSVNNNNISSFINCSNIDGALVGGASLKPDVFAELCKKSINL